MSTPDKRAFLPLDADPLTVEEDQDEVRRAEVDWVTVQGLVVALSLATLLAIVALAIVVSKVK